MNNKETKTCGECRYHKNNRCMLPCYTINHYAENSACHHFEEKTPPTIGDKIRQMSDEELAEKLVYCKHVQKIIGEMGYSYVSFASTIIKNEEFETKPEALAATVEELKKRWVE